MRRDRVACCDTSVWTLCDSAPLPVAGRFLVTARQMDTFVILFALTVVVAMVFFAAAIFIR